MLSVTKWILVLMLSASRKTRSDRVHHVVDPEVVDPGDATPALEQHAVPVVAVAGPGVLLHVLPDRRAGGGADLSRGKTR